MEIDFAKRLKREIFEDHPKNVAPKLLGKYLVVETNKGKIVIKITETEAYGGFEDAKKSKNWLWRFVSSRCRAML